MKEITQRESSFELLRLLSQYMIVLGHLLMVIVIPSTGIPFYKGMMFPLHVAVPCFVMISGYFGIRASVKGFVNLVKFVIVLYIPLLIAKFLINGGGINDVLAIIFPVSRTNTWFIRTYLWLFLLSPLMNKALVHSSISNKVSYALILFVISNYAGTIGNDASLIGGKNIVTFLFYYLIGHLLSQSKGVWEKWDRKEMTAIYLICNAVIVAFVSIYGNNRIVNGLFDCFFWRYNSPILWLNAILTFMLVVRVSLQSEIVNKLAKSCLSIYLLHCSFVSWLVVKPAMSYVLAASSSIPNIFIATCLMALLIVIVCVAVHFCLTPLWIIFDRLGEKLQNRTLIWWSCAVVKMRTYEK